MLPIELGLSPTDSGQEIALGGHRRLRLIAWMSLWETFLPGDAESPSAQFGIAGEDGLLHQAGTNGTPLGVVRSFVITDMWFLGLFWRKSERARKC